MVRVWLNSLALTGGLVSSEEDESDLHPTKMGLICNENLLNNAQNESQHLNNCEEVLPRTGLPTPALNNPLPDVVLSHTNKNTTNKKGQDENDRKPQIKTPNPLKSDDNPRITHLSDICSSNLSGKYIPSNCGYRLNSHLERRLYRLNSDSHNRIISRNHAGSSRCCDKRNSGKNNSRLQPTLMEKNIGSTLRGIGDEFQKTYSTTWNALKGLEELRVEFSPCSRSILVGCLAALFIFKFYGKSRQ